MVIKLPFTGSAQSLVDKAAKLAAANGARFSGTAVSGEFETSGFMAVKMTYRVVGQQIEFTVLKKPMLATMSKIESELKKLVN